MPDAGPEKKQRQTQLVAAEANLARRSCTSSFPSTGVLGPAHLPLRQLPLLAQVSLVGTQFSAPRLCNCLCFIHSSVA